MLPEGVGTMKIRAGTDTTENDPWLDLGGEG